MKKLHFKNLDSIRTIAFLMIFLHHSFNTSNEQLKSSELIAFVADCQEHLFFGVYLFFVLSGFLITYLLIRDKELNKFSISHFYTKRILRIWPVYFIVLAFSFVIYPLVKTYIFNETLIESANFFRYLFFLGNYDLIIAGQLPTAPGLGPIWSVSVEEQFYLFWPLLFLISLKKHKSFLLFLIIALTAICAFLSMAFNLNYYDTIHCTIALSVGGAFGYFAYYNTFKINSLGKLKGWFLILLLGGIIVFSSSYILPKVLSFLLFSIATSLLIIYQINCASNYDLKRIPLIEKLGKYTYGFYMYHSIAIFLIYNLFTRFLNLDDNIYHTLITIPLLSLGLTIVMGYYSYHYIEIKFLKIKDKLNNVKDKSIPSYVCNDDNSKLNG